MTLIKKIAINTVLLSSGRILTGLLQIIIIGLLARFFGAAGYGQYAFALTYVTFFNVLCVFMDSIVVRDVARHRDNASSIIGNAIILKTILCFSALLLLLISVFFSRSYISNTYLIQLLSLSLIFNIIQTPRIIFEADLRGGYIVFVDVISKLLGVLFLSVSGILKINLLYAAAALLLSEFIASLMIWFLSKKFVKPKLVFDFKALKTLFINCFPMLILGMVSVVYLRIDTVLLSVIKGDAAVGYYSGATNVMASAIVFSDSYARSVFPVISNFFNDQRENATFIFTRSLKYLSAGGLFFAIAGWSFSLPVIRLVMGDSFIQASAPLSILSIATGVIFISNILSITITAINKQQINMWLSISNMGVCILLNIILIPVFSFNGAAFARLITESFGCLLALLFVVRCFQITFSMSLFINIMRLVSTGILTMVVIPFLKDLSFPITISVLACVYFLFLLLLHWFDEKDLAILKMIFGGKML
ncbi:MAG: flippase [Chitinispirillaceae bacterium]|nr:flippase [Chitinispirillaceae bacterium]